MKNCRIVMFAKAPLAGYARTRLISVLGAEDAALLAHKLLDHAIVRALDAARGRVELCITPSGYEASEKVRFPTILRNQLLSFPIFH